MAEPVPSSPAWKKPSDVMKVRLKGKKQRSVSANYNQNDKQVALDTKPHPVAGSSRAGKRRNPFGQSLYDKKRAHSEVSSSQAEGALHNKLFQALDADGDEVFQEPNQSKVNLSTLIDRVSITSTSTNENTNVEDENATVNGSSQPSKPSVTWKDSYPVDWCLKTRVRFTSDSPFTWCGTLKTNEEASGLSWFTRGTVHDELAAEQQKSHVHSNWRSRLHQSTMVWMHPSFPWVKLYPRIYSDDKKARSSFVANDEKLQASLMSNWCESFRSLFHQLRAGHCPYFYLCGYQSTVLFRAAGAGGFKHVHAMLTPTTKGLRESLAEEGIELSMPLITSKESTSHEDNGENQENQQTRPVPVKTEEDEEEDEEEDYAQGDDAASSWLQSMGLDKQEFPTLDPRRVKFQRDESIKLDNRPQSLVLIEGGNTQALYNFLLNSDIMIAPTGSQAGIPPTLVAPAPFEGATLTTCKVKSGRIQQAVGNTMQECYHLEVTGPILPSNIHAMNQLLTTSQEDGFAVNMYNHTPTVMFSAVQSKNSVLSTQEKQDKLLNCNLCPELVEHLVKGEETDDHASIQEFRFAEGKYSWVSYS